MPGYIPRAAKQTKNCVALLPKRPGRAEGEAAWHPEYGSLVWVMVHGLRLAAPLVVAGCARDPDRFKLYLRMMIQLISTRRTDPAVLMEVSSFASHPLSSLLSFSSSALACLTFHAFLNFWRQVCPAPRTSAAHSCP